MRHRCWFVVVLLAGCSSKQITVVNPTITTATAGATQNTEAASISLALKEPTAEEKHDSALREALSYLADRRYDEALDALRSAQGARDSELVRDQITKVQGLQLRQSSFDEALADIQAILDQGQAEQAAQLAMQALAQFGDGEETTKLASLKRQADALLAVKHADVVSQVTRYKREAETALKENNLRAAQLAYDQWISLRPEPAAEHQAEQVKARLARYDAACARARQLRKNPLTLEDAVAAYQEALQAWDMQSAREELADAQLALENRRDRLAVATFEVHGDARLADLGTALPEELLPYFKRRYDLVERGQINQVLGELKLGNDDLVISDQGRSDLGRLARAQYLVVGSISPISGVTVHARLVDLRSGLIVQTAKIVAPSAADAIKQTPQLAALLLMTDEERLAYEQQLAREQGPPIVSTTSSQSPVPAVNDGGGPALVTTSNRPPALGGVQADDFDRLPPLPAFAQGTEPPPVESLTSFEQERPLRARLLTLHLELGDNLLRRGRFEEAVARFHLARELDPANLDILDRINVCQPHLPPVPRPRPRERLAFLNFLVLGDPRLVPPALSTWVPEQLTPYFGPAYDVVDTSEVYWMMGRLGLTVADIVRDSSARRWLGRSLGVRSLLLGRIRQTSSFTVTTMLIDAEQGWEVGRGQVFVRDAGELKLRLPELARLTLLSPVERARLEQVAAEQEAEYLRAMEAYQRGQFSLAFNLAVPLKKKHPFGVRIEFLVSEADRRARLAAREEARRQESDRQRQRVEVAARRQAELILAAERARQDALQRATAPADAERRRLRELASQQMVAQARIAFQNNRFGVAIQLFDGALAFRTGDDGLLREAAQARARVEEDRRRSLIEQQNRFEENLRRQRDVELVAARQQWQAERQRFEGTMSFFFDVQHRQDESEYRRLLDQAQRLKAQARHDQAAALLQTARRLRPGEEVERLLGDALMEQARAQAKAQDVARLAELERKLAQEQARRKQAEQDAQKNWQLYQAALQAAQDAQRRKDYSAARAKYQEASRLLQTEAAIAGMQTASAALDQEARQASAARQQAEANARRAGEVAQLLSAAKTAELARKFDDALRALRQAKALDATSLEVMTALTRVEQARINSFEERQARDQSGRVTRMIVQARGHARSQQYEAALAVLAAAQQLAPEDNVVATFIAWVKKAQADTQAALVAARQKEEEERRLAESRIRQEEQAKQQATQGRQQAEAALKSGDLKMAESALAAVAKLTPHDPELRKLQQELTKAQSIAARERAQADARARLEAEAQQRASAAARQQQGEITKILTQAQQATTKKDFAAAEKLINDAIALDPTNLAIGRAQRDLQNARKLDANARAAMSAEQKKKDDADLAKKKTEFNKLMKDGRQALAAEEYDKAAKLFEAAARLNPDDNDAPLLLGMARRDIERAKAEAEAARRATMEEEARKKKEEEDARKREMAEDQARKKAEEDLRQRLATDAETKKRAEALKALTRQQFDTAVKSGKQAVAARRYDEAVKSFERATQLMPDDQDARALLRSAKQQRDAAKTPEKGSGTAPEKSPLPNATQLLAQAAQLQRQQKWAEALKIYEQVLAANPSDKTARGGATACEFNVNLDAGKAALARKDRDAAVKALEAALKLVPKHTEGQKLLKQARELD